MARQLCNEYGLLTALVTEPLVGRWVANVEVASEVEPTDPVTLSFEGGEVELVGAIHRGGVESGRWLGRIVGGTGGLSTTLTAQAYRAMPFSTILSAIMADTGETLSTTSTSLLTRYAPYWHRVSGRSALESLASLAEAVELTWRVLRDGTVWIGAETWPALDCQWSQVHALPDLGMAEIAPAGGPLVRPGVTWDGQHVGAVVTRLESGSLRQEVWRAAD